MTPRKSIWQDVMAFLKKEEARLPAVWPPELPPEKTPDFWFIACKFEMSTRDTVSAKLRSLAYGAEAPSTTPLEAWFFRRRFEWAAQVSLSKVMKKEEPQATLSDVLNFLLVDSWQSDGCQALWKHAERDGRVHPENLDGLAPIP